MQIKIITVTQLGGMYTSVFIADINVSRFIIYLTMLIQTSRKPFLILVLISIILVQCKHTNLVCIILHSIKSNDIVQIYLINIMLIASVIKKN